MTDEMIRVEVAHARPDRQLIVQVELPAGATIREAIIASRLEDQFDRLVVAEDQVGVWGRRRPLDHALVDGDRVEIYRPLIADPKDIRRQRAAAGKGSSATLRPGRPAR